MPTVELTESEWELIRRLRRAKGLPEGGLAAPPVDPVRDWLGRFRALVGDAAADRDAGKWRHRLNTRRMACEAVLQAVLDRIAAGQPIREPAAYMERCWQKYT
jgi:hypothetical protein